jgi:integrase
MPKPLTAKRVLRARKTPGRYPDGTVAGLYLQITSPQTRDARGAASWILRYERDGRERMFGLGPLDVVSLKQARERARIARLQLLDGIDPIEQRKAARAARALEAARTVTFQQAAQSYFGGNQAKWRSPRHAREFIRSLERLAFPTLGTLPISAIDTGLVLRVIEPLWKRIPETASRLRGRIEMVLDWATVRGLRAGDNPARWSGHIEHLLPARAATDIKHFAALPYAELPAFMAELRQRDGVAERALELCILCASRSGEILGARWPEIDLDTGVWTVPARRMKGGEAHRVPLSSVAVALLRNLPGKSNDGPVFIGTRPGTPLGKDALARALARMGCDGITTHGFRSTFRDWAAERTAFSYAARELALAHAVHSKQSRAYERTDLLDERRKLMSKWAAFSYGPAAASEVVVPMRGRRA